MSGINIVFYNNANLYQWQDERKSNLEVLENCKNNKTQYANDLKKLFVESKELILKKNSMLPVDFNQEHQILTARVLSLIESLKSVKVRIEKLEKQNEILDKQIVEAQRFLYLWENQPDILVGQLRAEIDKKLNDYEMTYFVNLPPQTRTGLILLRYELDKLLFNAYDKVEQQRCYLRICGLLWDKHQELQKLGLSAKFRDCLAQLINSTHINPEAACYEGFSAIAWYQAIKNAYPSIFSVSKQDLLNKEMTYLHQLMSNLMKLNQDTALHTKIVKAAVTIDQEIRDKVKKNIAVDYHFYITLAENLTKLYHNPSDQKTLQQLHNMTHYASEHALLSQQALGGLLTIMGVALIASSVALFTLTWGGSFGLSAWAATVGLGLFEYQVGATLTLGLTAAAGSKLLFWGDNYLSKREGLAPELTDVRHAAEDESIAHYIPVR